MKTLAARTTPKELFRYARLAPPRIVDVQARASNEGGDDVPPDSADSAARKDWAERFSKSKEFVENFNRLELPPIPGLAIRSVPKRRIPCRDCVKDARALADYLTANDDALKIAKRRVSLSLYAAAALGRRQVALELNRTLQFLEALPTLAEAERERPYAPPVFARYRKVGTSDVAQQDFSPRVKAKQREAPVPRRELLRSWELANDFIAYSHDRIDKSAEEIRSTKFEFEAPEGLSDPRSDKERERLRAVRREQHRAYVKSKKESLEDLVRERRSVNAATPHQRVAMMKADAGFRDYVEQKYGEEAAVQIAAVALPSSKASSFCQLFEEEAADRNSRDQPGCTVELDNPCIERLLGKGHHVPGEDDVRLLGTAELVTVEESWVRYSPGEISYVETILKGELRHREVKSTRYTEELTEELRQQTDEQSAETESKVQQDLTTQIQTELASRFDSNVDASANGSGGGTIGVVDFQGGASFSAGIGIGLDTSLSTSSESRFSQEIVSKALERTKRVNSELRRNRSFRLFETCDTHAIDNTGSGSSHTNGIYCYLDKTVCITERIYGMRTFLGAELLYPGRDLLVREADRFVLDLHDRGLPPRLDITPADITPANYLSLVGKYRASNVEPPPPALKVVSKTYKTDTTNESKQDDSTFKKVTKTLAPFFGEYKRFLIQDVIEIPEGYRVQEVHVTVTHGSNGMSIPAHLPFSLMGAAIYALPIMGVAAIPPYTFCYLPIAAWQVLFTASPLLHYNADSSNVTINVGHQTAESPYFFFQPDFLIQEVIDALSNSSFVTQDFIDFLQQKLNDLYQGLTSQDAESLTATITGLSGDAIAEINGFIGSLTTWLGNLVTNTIPNLISGGSASEPAFDPLPTINPSVIAAIPAALLAPFQEFFDGIVSHIEQLIGDPLGDIFEYFASMMDNTDTKTFSGMQGFTEALPVSLNTIALKPGVTVNLTACMVRIDNQSLDAWRLETFERLNQAYYQLEADYQARVAGQTRPPHRDSPGLMRVEEREVIKNRIIAALYLKHDKSGNTSPTLEEYRLFEHAIDWENVTYRVFRYGPRGEHLAFDKLGLYERADERRRHFLESSWAQVMIPLREDKRLEQVMLDYLANGVVDFEADLLAELDDGSGDPMDELTEIYRDLVLQRERLDQVPERHQLDVVPTDLIVLYEPQPGEPYPVNSVDCANEDGE